MLKLYYTSSRSYLGQQGKANQSLGGFPSSSPVPNSQLGNLFSSITSYTKQNEITEVIGLILKNEDDNDVENLQFYFDLPENMVAKFEIAAVALQLNSKNQYYMEELSNSQSLPTYAEFHEADGLSNAVSLGILQADQMLGVWIKRTVTFSVKTDDQLWEDYLNNVEIVNKENVRLKFIYDQSIIDSKF
jgi:hypothetical protein